VKLFPASLVGGPKMLKALSSVFRDVRFMQDAIEAGDFAAITTLAQDAIKLANA